MIDPITPHEFTKIRDLLVSVCGIDLKPDQDYLVETRLSELATELGVANFGELHRSIVGDPELLPRVVDLMTTNETLWFRDDSCWATLKESLIPRLIEKARAGEQVRIWSAASSTGQEAYSFVMLVTELLSATGEIRLLDRFQIVGTDISRAAVFLAKNGKYDPFTISRGLSKERLARFFDQEETRYSLKEEIKSRVEFKVFNLMDSFMPLGKFDLVFCRNVAIYFSIEFKTELFGKIARQLKPDGTLILGATESLFNLKTPFKDRSFKNGIYYVLETHPDLSK